MSIELDAVVIENFMPFVGRYEVPLARQGLVFIVGENRVSKMSSGNGSGKSSIFDSLSWSLYDKILRGTTGERYVNKRCDRAVVETYFHVKDTPYVAKREQSGRTRSWELFELIGEERRRLGTGEQISRLLGLSFQGFQSTLLFGVSGEKRFGGQSDAPRKQLFDELLDLAFFGQRRKVVEAERTEQLLGLQRAEERRIAITASIGSLEAERVALEEKYHAMLREQSSRQTTLLDEQRVLYGELDQLVREYLRAYEGRYAESQLIDESTRIVALRTRITQQLDATEASLARLARQRDETLELESCPVCRRPIEGAEGSIESYFTIESSPLHMTREEQLAHVRVLGHVLECWPSVDVSGHYEHLRERCVRVLERIKSRPWGEALDEERYLRSALDDLGERLVGLSNEDAALSKEEAVLRDAVALREFWVEGFGHRGLKAILLREYDTFIGERLATYAESLTAGEMELIFHSHRTLKSGEVRDEIEFEVRNRYGADCYDDCSSGEKQRVDLCLVLALQDVVRELHHGHFSLALFDEVFEHFDELGIEQAIEFFTNERREIGSIFVISQNQKLLSHSSDHLIRVIKTKEGSSIHVD